MGRLLAELRPDYAYGYSVFTSRVGGEVVVDYGYYRPSNYDPRGGGGRCVPTVVDFAVLAMKVVLGRFGLFALPNDTLV